MCVAPSNITEWRLWIATRTHGHVSTHVRWLYNLIRVANAAAVFDGFFLGPSTKAVSAIAEWLGGFLVTCSWGSGAIVERVLEPGQLITVLLELSGKAQKLLPAACAGMTAGRSPHM